MKPCYVLHTHPESLAVLSCSSGRPCLCTRCLPSWCTWNRTLTHCGSQNTFALWVPPHKKNEIVWRIYYKWDVQSNMLLNTRNVSQVCPATWDLPKYGELSAIEKNCKKIACFFFPIWHAKCGHHGKQQACTALQMNVKAPSTEPFLQRAGAPHRGFHFSHSFESQSVITPSTRPFFLILKLYPPLPTSSPTLLFPPLLSPLLSLLIVLSSGV